MLAPAPTTSRSGTQRRRSLADIDEVRTSAYPDRWDLLAMSCLGTIGALTVGIWRGILYGLPPEVWALEAAALALGVAAATRRKRTGWNDAVFGLPLVALESLRHTLHLGPGLTAAAFFFGGGWLAARTLTNIADGASGRRRVIDVMQASGGLLADGSAIDLRRYLAEAPALNRRAAAAGNMLRQARRALGRDPRIAAAHFRQYAAAVDALVADRKAASGPATLQPLAHASNTVLAGLGSEARGAAADLELGADVEFARFKPLLRESLAVSRDWLYGVRLVARHHRIRLPRWFCVLECRLAQTAI